MEATRKKTHLRARIRSMLAVDFRRMFTTSMLYILVGICLVMPVATIVMTSMMDGNVMVDPQTGAETAMKGFQSTWEAIGSVSGTSAAMDMSLASMCNINMLYFFLAVLVGLFVSEDFKSGYAKNLFAVRALKGDYVISKTLVCFVGGVLMLLAYFAGAMLGGAIAGLSFDPGMSNAFGIGMCMISKLFLVAVFVGIDLLIAVAAKQKTWLSIVGAMMVSMLLYMMVPLMTPLNSSMMNVILCLAGGALFSAGLGIVSKMVLGRTSLV